MANTIIQLKHSTVQGNIPVSLANGEISINTRDGKLFYADPTGTIQEFSGFPGPSGLDTEIQFNDGGVLGSSANLTFNKSSGLFSTKQIHVTNSDGDEGGEILLAKAVTNTTLDGTGITIDSYRNKIRFFEQGGSARGAYIDLTECVGGAGTNLLNPTATPDAVARDTANAAFIQANSSFNVANGAIAVNLTQNTNIQSAWNTANAAFDAANTASGGNSFGVIYTSNNSTFANALVSTDQITFTGVDGVSVAANSITKTIVFAGTPGAQGLTVDYGLVTESIAYSLDYGTL